MKNMRYGAFMLAVCLSGCIIVPVPIVLPVPQSTPKTVQIDAQGKRVVTRPPVDPGVAPASSRCAPAAQAQAFERQMLQEINAYRRAGGLSALRLSAKLTAVAQAHACDNGARGSYAHNGSDGSILSQRLARGGYRPRTAAENTGLGFDGSPQKMLDYWKNSKFHNANLLNPAMTEVGLGVAGQGKTAWVLVMGAPR